MIQTFDSEIIEKIIEQLNMKSEYIEIGDVKLSKMNCFVCDSELNIPEGSEAIVCESCGSTNKIKSKEIQCINCSAPFKPNNINECPFCGSKMIAIGKSETPVQKIDAEKPQQKEKSGGFFIKLFGKK